MLHKCNMNIQLEKCLRNYAFLIKELSKMHNFSNIFFSDNLLHCFFHKHVLCKFLFLTSQIVDYFKQSRRSSAMTME